MKSATDATPLPAAARVFQRMFTRLGCQGRPPRFVVELYPYSSLMHTIRLREDLAQVRLSDALRAAPLEVLEAAATILLARLYRRRAPRQPVETYRRFVLARGTRRRMRRLRQKRARRSASGPRGTYHDLARMFTRLNLRYFAGRLRCPRLGWSARAWRRQLGCFDPDLDQIVINARLDDRTVPAYAVQFVLYHEMLHVKHPLRVAHCGLQSHSPEFRLEEKRFARYAQARKFLGRLA